MAGPVANMNLTRLNSNPGLYGHTQPPSKAELTAHMREEAWTQQPTGGRPNHDCQTSRPRKESILSPPTTTTTISGGG